LAIRIDPSSTAVPLLNGDRRGSGHGQTNQIRDVIGHIAQTSIIDRDRVRHYRDGNSVPMKAAL
jgi:hypothetical protein